MLVALFDSELLCSPPSNRATKRLACVGFVWQADMGDEYDIITTAAAATATATAYCYCYCYCYSYYYYYYYYYY